MITKHLRKGGVVVHYERKPDYMKYWPVFAALVMGVVTFGVLQQRVGASEGRLDKQESWLIEQGKTLTDIKVSQGKMETDIKYIVDAIKGAKVNV